MAVSQHTYGNGFTDGYQEALTDVAQQLAQSGIAGMVEYIRTNAHNITPEQAAALDGLDDTKRS